MEKKTKPKFYGIDLFKNKNLENMTDVLWGNFDSIKFTDVSQIIQTNNSNSTNDIPGDRIYIYETIQENNIKYDSEKNIFISNNAKQYNFIGVTLFNFHNELYTKAIPKIIEKSNLAVCNISKHLYENIKTPSDEIIFDVFGALNSYDICVVSVFNNIGDFISIVEDFQNFFYENNQINYRGSLFESSYSILTSTFLNTDVNIFQNSDGVANIQITYNCNTCLNEVVSNVLGELNLFNEKGTIKEEYKNEVKVFSTLGEFDIVIQLPIYLLNNQVYKEFLNPNNLNYKKYIQQCNTRFSKKIDNTFFNKEYIYSETAMDKINNSNADNLLAYAEETFEQLKNNTLYNENHCIKEIFDMIYNDYKQAMKISNRSNVWLEDLTEQFKAIIGLATLVFDNYLNNQIQYNIFEFSLDLANVFRQSIYHVKQSNASTPKIIQSLFRNAVTYDKIINCYYFIVKNILSYAYKYGSTEQSTLIPFINFEAVNIIKSELILGTEESKERILAIYLPYHTFYNIDLYIPLLYHEIGHYISPKDRVERNIYALRIVTTLVIKNIIQEYKDITVDYSQTTEIYNYITDKLADVFIDRHIEILNYTWSNFYQIIRSAFNGIMGFESIESTHAVLINELQSIIKSVVIKFGFEDIPKIKINENKLWSDIDGVMEGIREATADMFMIYNTGMKIHEYLALFIFIRYRHHWQNDNTVLSNVRISIVLEYYMKRESKDEVFGLSENIKDDVFNIAKKIIPETFKDKIKSEIDTINLGYMKFQDFWKYLLQVFIDMTDQVCLNTEESLLFNKDLKSFYDLLHKNSFYDGTSEKYLQWINLSFGQQSLKNINENRKSSEKKEKKIYKLKSISKESDFRNIPSVTIYSFGDFNKALELMCGMIGEEKDIFWYRGQSDKAWPLKPALFRNVGRKKRYNFLCQAYQDFVALSADSAELRGNIRTEADWISYMQHYLIPTNFLDWTEQPLSALYFALENFFEFPCKELKNDPTLEGCKNDKIREKYSQDSVIWVLNPKRMNKLIYDNNDLFDVCIPNLSISSVLTPNTNRFLISQDKEVLTHNKKDFTSYCPMAITTSRLSNRIRSQTGHFVAFDVHVDDNDIHFEENEYEALTQLDVFAKEFFNIANIKEEYRKPFIGKIIIPSYVKKKMSKHLRHMGITISSIYPELDNIGKDITKRYL